MHGCCAKAHPFRPDRLTRNRTHNHRHLTRLSDGSDSGQINMARKTRNAAHAATSRDPWRTHPWQGEEDRDRHQQRQHCGHHHMSRSGNGGDHVSLEAESGKVDPDSHPPPQDHRRNEIEGHADVGRRGDRHHPYQKDQQNGAKERAPIHHHQHSHRGQQQQQMAERSQRTDSHAAGDHHGNNDGDADQI